ncbi:hypothetical protein LOTGIDRAFT_157640 [Lottia gigantea]|uniref:Coilin tudor domain-containing protein n=1 Tax=Lottia gigantea TaxID=225164 RepID=V4CH73_LOTGI|nr:hypothetical protein LOTGIDRAFT_157640 [Lottia gigantea]ESP01455.1 hypothetical protein LOTGIDRAFT_157640 [Lottia gigantea]
MAAILLLSGTIKNNQIYSMFNNLQCQLMTLQSTMVSLQMNQNILQSTVEAISKSVNHINSKVDDIHSCYGYNSVDGTVSTTTVIESVESKELDSGDSCLSKKKKKKKKSKAESTEESECSELKKRCRSKSINVSNCLSELKLDKNVNSAFEICELQSEPTENMVMEVTADKSSKKEKKSIKDDKLKTINIDESESKINDSDVLFLSEIVESKPEEKLSRNRKRKRNRKKKSAEVTVLKSPSPHPLPKVVTLNLPNYQQPNNTKITFCSDSDSDSENMIKSNIKDNSQNSLSFTKAATSTQKVNAYQEMVPCKLSVYNIKSCQNKVLIAQDKENRPNKPLTSHVVSTQSGTKPRKNSLVIADVLNQIRCEADSNDLNNEVDEKDNSPVDSQDVKKNSKKFIKKTPSVKNLSKVEVETFIAIPVKDYNIYPILSGPPRKGDQIAYKILELSEDYNPVISAYKEAEVLSYESDSNILYIKLSEPLRVKEELGKFDMPVDKADENLDQIEVNWKEMIEPRLLPLNS